MQLFPLVWLHGIRLQRFFVSNDKAAGREKPSQQKLYSFLRDRLRSSWEVLMKKTIITVIGKDRVGIIAAVCTFLAQHNINILDIDQSIIQGYFHMMMIVDANQADQDFSLLASELASIGEGLGVQIKMQHEDIFDVMHRI